MFSLVSVSFSSKTGKICGRRMRTRLTSTPLYQLHRYVPPQRVWFFFNRFGLKTGIDFDHYGLKSGTVYKGTTKAYKRIMFFAGLLFDFYKRGQNMPSSYENKAKVIKTSSISSKG